MKDWNKAGFHVFFWDMTGLNYYGFYSKVYYAVTRLFFFCLLERGFGFDFTSEILAFGRSSEFSGCFFFIPHISIGWISVVNQKKSLILSTSIYWTLRILNSLGFDHDSKNVEWSLFDRFCKVRIWLKFVDFRIFDCSLIWDVSSLYWEKYSF